MMTGPLSEPMQRSQALSRLAVFAGVRDGNGQRCPRWCTRAGYLTLALLGSAMVVPLVVAADSYIVSQRKREFWPHDLKLTRGSVISIVNDDKVTHHVFIKHKKMKFDSGEQPIGKTVLVKFDKKGRFAIRCAIHPLMRLTVVVE